MLSFLWQTAARFSYSVLIEEGLSHESFTTGMGERPIVLHPDGDLTINYFDTDNMPLGQLQLATSVALVARMIGEAPGIEAQQIRQAILGQYIQQLYQDTFEEWSKRNSEKLPELQRLACAIHRWKQRMVLGSTELDAYAALRDRNARNDDEALQFLSSISEGEITAFLKNPQTERAVMALAHAYYMREDFPTHASLVELMQFARFSEHKKEQVDHLATLLSAWCAHGQYGRLFDGATNISLTGSVAHFKLGYIPEQATELKTAAGLLISGFTRQHIISLPRATWKRIVCEELARFLDVRGGEKIVAESYAQLRKFNCWMASIVQQYGKFKDSRIRPVVVGNCKQFWLLRQFDRNDVDDIAKDIGLPESVCASIQKYPMPEQQPVGNKFSSMCFFSPVSDPPVCGTVRNVEIAEEVSHESVVKSALWVHLLPDGRRAAGDRLQYGWWASGRHWAGWRWWGCRVPSERSQDRRRGRVALLGYLGSQIAKSEVRQERQNAEQEGYDRTTNQAVKQHCWAIQNDQRIRQSATQSDEHLVPVVIPESTINGVIQKEHVEYLRVP